MSDLIFLQVMYRGYIPIFNKMKIFVSILLVFILKANDLHAQIQVTVNPKVSSTNTQGITITRIETSTTQTIIDLKVRASKNRLTGMLSFSSGIILVPHIEDYSSRIKKYLEFNSLFSAPEFGKYMDEPMNNFRKGNLEPDIFVSSWENHDLNSWYSIFSKDEISFNFRLNFPPLPPGVTNFSFLEVGSGGFIFEDIEINNLDRITVNTSYKRSDLISDWNKNGLKPFEGIYRNEQNSNYYEVALKATEEYPEGVSYSIIFLKSSYSTIWKEGELKATAYFNNSSTSNSTDWLGKYKKLFLDAQITLTNSGFELEFKDGSLQKFDRIIPSPIAKSGTGFAISSSGYIVTNHHVIEGGIETNVKGINGDFNKAYRAIVVANDMVNDISILKITDPNFSKIGVIPYSISNKIIDVGTPIYSLGYPERAILGEEIKYTNGSISSKSGFQGDVTNYQMTTPIQSGNSGGPVFNTKGEVIGISVSKIIKDNVDNVSFCIKTPYLLGLIENYEPKITLPAISQLSSKSIPEQIKAIKNFVYIIEVR
jgi:S1-C subfamily serine protease